MKPNKTYFNDQHEKLLDLYMLCYKQPTCWCDFPKNFCKIGWHNIGSMLT
jgi:hypothetical protein